MSILRIIHNIEDFLLYILDFIFPKSEKQRKVETLDARNWRNLSKVDTHENVLFFFPYDVEVVRDAIWEIKYKRNRKIREMIVGIMSEYLLEEVAEKMQMENFGDPIITSIPQSKKRKSERGFDQGEDLSRDLGKRLSIPYQSVLIKTRETVRQTTLKRNERLQNMKGSFGIAPNENVVGGNIIVIDDVTTTGATLNEIKKTLLKAGARKVWLLAVAH